MLGDPGAHGLRAPVLLSGRIPELPHLTRAGDSLGMLSVHPMSKIGTRHFILDGAAICGGRVVTRKSELATVIPDQVLTSGLGALANWWAEHVSNPSCLFVLDEATHEAVCLPDPLGGSLVFRYSAGGTDFISSDIVSLVRAAELAGCAPQKSVDFQLERLILGNGGLTPTSYAGVERLDLFEYWEASAEATQPREYDLAGRVRSEKLSYVDALNRIRAEILESVAAISTAPSDFRVAHLTGGFDSRLVLAAMVDADCTDRFNFFCSGPPGTNDRNVADGLSGIFGLQRTQSGGLSPTPTPHVHERLLAPVFHSGGMTSTGPTGRELETTVVAAGGGYGEILRTFYSSRFKDLEHRDFSGADLMKHMVPPLEGRETIHTPGARERIGNQLEAEWRKLSARGAPDDFIGDAMYSQIRNRYHIGQNSMLWSRIGSRLDPLYSVTAYQLARALPLETREANVIGFDLMDSFAGDLKSYPFDKNRFSATYASMRRLPPERPLASEPDPRKPRTFSAPHRDIDLLPERLSDLHVDEPQASPSQREEFVKVANSIGVNYWQVSTLPAAQAALRTALEAVDVSPFDDSLNVGYLRRLSQAKLSRRQEVRDVYSAFGLLAWLGN